MIESALMTDGLGSNVAQTDLGMCRVSTVFLGLDHRPIGEGPPILFETMVFSETEGLREQGRRRYCTWAEAEVGHMEVVEAIREEIAKLEKNAADTAAAALRRAVAANSGSGGPGR